MSSGQKKGTSEKKPIQAVKKDTSYILLEKAGYQLMLESLR